MRVKDFKGREYPWPPTGHIVSVDTRPRSQYHTRCRELLRKLYPTQPILEEVTLPGVNLYLDFYLHFRRIAVEVNGEQHYKFNPHFYQNKLAFFRARQNDSRKAEWCQMNSIVLVTLDWNKDDAQWTADILNA